MEKTYNINYDYVFIDVSSVFHPLYYQKNKTPIIKTIRGEKVDTSTICAYLRKIYGLRKEFPKAKFIHVMDPLTYDLSERRKIDPEYKSNRKEKEPSLIKQLEMLPKVLNFLGEVNIQPQKYEADDVIASLITKMAYDGEIEKGKRALIYSADKDLLQMMLNDENYHFLTKFGYSKNDNGEFEKDMDIISSLSQVENKLGVMPLLVPDLLAIMGDNADGIKGINGLGQKKTSEILNKYGNFVNFIQNLNDVNIPENYKKIFSDEDNVKTVFKNLKLTVLNFELPLPKDILTRVLPLERNNVEIISKMVNVDVPSLLNLKNISERVFTANNRQEQNLEKKIDNKVRTQNQNNNLRNYN